MIKVAQLTASILEIPAQTKHEGLELEVAAARHLLFKENFNLIVPV